MEKSCEDKRIEREKEMEKEKEEKRVIDEQNRLYNEKRLKKLEEKSKRIVSLLDEVIEAHIVHGEGSKGGHLKRDNTHNIVSPPKKQRQTEVYPALMPET